VHWTLTAVAKREEVWMFAFVHWLLPARNMLEVLLSHGNSRPHKCAHHKICVNRVAAPTLQSRYHMVRFSSVCTCERQPVKKLFCEWQGTAEYHMPVVAEEREQSVNREKTNKMQQSDVYYQLLSLHVSGIIMAIFRRTKTVCYCIWCPALVLLDVVGSGCGALRCRMRALWRLLSD